MAIPLLVWSGVLGSNKSMCGKDRENDAGCCGLEVTVFLGQRSGHVIGKTLKDANEYD